MLSDCRIAWDVPDVKPHGPDIAVIFGVRERKNWGTFDVATEGMRPALIVEVTSPDTRHLDRVNKLDEYELVEVPLYVIVDLVSPRAQPAPRLLAYHLTPMGYAALPLNDQGRLWLEPVRAWLGIEAGQIVCYDEARSVIPDYTGPYRFTQRGRSARYL